MRIGVVATSYPRWPGDAAGGFVEGHAAYLREHGAEVEVIAAGQGLPAPALFYRGGAPEMIERGGASVIVDALGFSARMMATVAWRARRWDAMVAHWLAPSAVAAAVAPRRVPLLAIAHGGDVFLLARAKLLAPVLALLVARDARLVFVSEDLRRFAMDAVPRRIAARVSERAIVQAMGVDDGRSEAIRVARDMRPPLDSAATASLGAIGGTRGVIGVVLARLVPVKSVETAIAALAHLPAHVKLVIAGDGPLRAALEAQAAPFGDRVRFTGWLDADARDALLATADVVVVPSAPIEGGRREGAPMAAREALAAGIPLVASATGGLVELADHGAHLVPPRDPLALARAIADAGGAPLPPRTEFGWRHAGVALDRHWRRAGRADRYAPAPTIAQPSSPQWSSRRAVDAEISSSSGDLNVTRTR